MTPSSLKRLHNSLTVVALLFSISTYAQACTYKDSRICQIDTSLRLFSNGPTVQYEEVGSGDIKSRAEAEWIAGGISIIRLSSTYEFSKAELMYLMAHEYAHLLLRHSRRELELVASEQDRLLSDVELTKKYGVVYDTPSKVLHSQEFEADAFAARFMYYNNIQPLPIFKRLILPSGGSDSHPAKKERLKQASALIDVLSQQYR